MSIESEHKSTKAEREKLRIVRAKLEGAWTSIMSQSNFRVSRLKHVPFLLIAGLYLLFVFKPFHIDDRLYLEVADNILLRPWLPYDFPITFEGQTYTDAAGGSHLPLTAYYIALVKAVTHSEEAWVFHVAFLIFPIIVGITFFDISSHFVRSRAAAAATLLVSPGLFVSGQSLMTDIPQLSFWLMAISGFLRISTNPRQRAAWILSIVGLCGAALISLLAVGLVCLLLAYWVVSKAGLRQRRGSHCANRVLFLALIPFLIWVAWYGAAYWVYDRFVLADLYFHVQERGPHQSDVVASKILSFVLNLGGTLLFPPTIWYGFAKRSRLVIGTITMFVGFFMVFSGPWQWDIWGSSLFAVLLSTGIVILMVLLERILQPIRSVDAKELLLSLWFWGILAACLLAYYNGAVRYTVLAVPPVILLWIRSIEGRRVTRLYVKSVLWSTFLLTALYSLWLALPDYRLAEAYRKVAREIVLEHSAPKRTIWFTAEWGLRYYLEKSGAKLLRRAETAPSPGDLLIKPKVASPWMTLYDRQPYSEPVDQLCIDSPGFVDLLNRDTHAGFYSTAWGILPFSISSAPCRDRLDILRVRKKYTGPIPISPEEFFNLDYLELRRALVETMQQVIPRGARVLVVCKGDEKLIEGLGPNYSHFPQSEGGVYAGHYPADGQEAVSHLVYLESKGAQFILFPETSRWWLGHYTDLTDYLHESGGIVFDQAGLGILFQLGN